MSTMTSWGPNRLDLFVVGANSELQHKWWDGSNWGPSLTAFENQGGRIYYDPECVSWGRDRLDVFVVGPSSAVYHKWWDGSRWGPSLTTYESMGGIAVGSPAAVSWGSDRIDLFVIGTDRGLYHKWWNGSAWGPSLDGAWENLGGKCLYSKPAVVSWGANRLDCFHTGLDAALYHKYFDGTKWSHWDRVGLALVGEPHAVCWGNNRIDVFAKGMDSTLQHTWWNGSSWGGRRSLGGRLLYDPEAVSWGPNRLDVFVVGTDGALYHKWWNGSAWGPSQTGYERHGDICVKTPKAVCWGKDRIDVFVIGADSAVHHKWWNGRAWGHSLTGSEGLGGLRGAEQPNQDCAPLKTGTYLIHNSRSRALLAHQGELVGLSLPSRGPAIVTDSFQVGSSFKWRVFYTPKTGHYAIQSVGSNHWLFFNQETGSAAAVIDLEGAWIIKHSEVKDEYLIQLFSTPWSLMVSPSDQNDNNKAYLGALGDPPTKSTERWIFEPLDDKLESNNSNSGDSGKSRKGNETETGAGGQGALSGQGTLNEAEHKGKATDYTPTELPANLPKEGLHSPNDPHNFGSVKVLKNDDGTSRIQGPVLGGEPTQLAWLRDFKIEPGGEPDTFIITHIASGSKLTYPKPPPPASAFEAEMEQGLWESIKEDAVDIMVSLAKRVLSWDNEPGNATGIGGGEETGPKKNAGGTKSPSNSKEEGPNLQDDVRNTGTARVHTNDDGSSRIQGPVLGGEANQLAWLRDFVVEPAGVIGAYIITDRTSGRRLTYPKPTQISSPTGAEMESSLWATIKDDAVDILIFFAKRVFSWD